MRTTKPPGRLAARAEAIAILRARQHQIVRVIAVRRSRQNVRRDIHEISADDVQVLFVRVQQDGVRAVIAAAAHPLAQQFDLVELVIAMRGLAAEQAEDLVAIGSVAAAIDVKAVECEEHSHDLAEGDLENLRLRDLAVLDREAGDRFLLFGADEQPPLRIFGDRNPRAFRGRVRRADEFHFEARKRFKRLRFRRLPLGEEKAGGGSG